MASLENQIIEIPNLLDYPYTIQQVVLNNILYYFYYSWNIRHEKAYLSIYTKEDNQQKYFVKNVCLINGVIISKYIRDNNWSGMLSFGKKNLDDNSNYRIDTINTNFQIIYQTGE